MTFKPGLWRPIAIGLSVINLVAVGFAAAAAEPWHAGVHAALALAFGLWAQQLGKAPRGAELAQLKEQLEQQAAALEEMQVALANQSSQLAELHERVDFAERLLTQLRDRPALGARGQGEGDGAPRS